MEHVTYWNKIKSKEESKKSTEKGCEIGPQRQMKFLKGERFGPVARPRWRLAGIKFHFKKNCSMLAANLFFFVFFLCDKFKTQLFP